MFPQLSVKEIMSDLLDANLIKQEDLIKLKKEPERVDPNLIMQLRHDKIKERRLARRKEKGDGEECTIRIKKTRKEIIGNETAKGIGTDKLTEAIIIDKEIKKCQKRCEMENRKMKNLVSEIKDSGKEVKIKRKRLKDKRTKRKKVNDKINLVEPSLFDYSSNQVPPQEQNLAGTSTKSIEDIKSTTLNEDFVNLSKIQIYINTIVDIDQEGDTETNNINGHGNQMEIIQKSYEAIQIEEVATTSRQHVKCDLKQTVRDKSSKKIVKRRFKLAESSDNSIFYSASSTTNEANMADEGANISVIENLTKGSCRYDAKDFTDNTDNIKDGSSRAVQSENHSNKLKQKNDVMPEEKMDRRQKDRNHFNFDKEKYLASKFVEKWKSSVKKNKRMLETDETIKQGDYRLRNVVESKFETFINKLQKKLSVKVIKCQENENDKKTSVEPETVKPETSLKRSGYGEKFKNRLKAQKEIIDEQRQILKDQKLKIKQLEENERSTTQKRYDKMKEKREINNNQILRKDRAEMKKDVPDFLEGMNRRAEERKERWEKLNELKTLKEEEKIKLKIQQDEELKKKEREKKYAALQSEQMEYLRKILDEEKRKTEIENIEKAERKLVALNRSILLSRYMNLWKQIVNQRRQQIEQVRHIDELSLKSKVMHILKIHRQRIIIQKRELAQAFRISKLQKKYWTIWFKEWMEMKQMRQVAEDYNDYRLTKKFLIGLLWNKRESQSTYDCLMLEAVAFHSMKLLMKGFRSLQIYPTIIYEEREREKRLRSWEDKVKEVIPDFSIS